MLQKMHTPFTMLVIIVGLLASQATFGMDDQQIPQAECSICGNKNPLKTKGVNTTRTTWQKKRTYNLNLPLNNLDSSIPNSALRKDGSPRYSPRTFTNVPIVHTDECSHHVCIQCTELSKSFDPDERGCRLCPYARARFQHAQCNITGCNSSSHQVKQYAQHAHGLCYGHMVEIAKIHTPGCTICYAQKNPEIFDEYPFCQICKSTTDHIDINASCTHYLCTTSKIKAKPLCLMPKYANNAPMHRHTYNTRNAISMGATTLLTHHRIWFT